MIRRLDFGVLEARLVEPDNHNYLVTPWNWYIIKLELDPKFAQLACAILPQVACSNYLHNI